MCREARSGEAAEALLTDPGVVRPILRHLRIPEHPPSFPPGPTPVGFPIRDSRHWRGELGCGLSSARRIRRVSTRAQERHCGFLPIAWALETGGFGRFCARGRWPALVGDDTASATALDRAQAHHAFHEDAEPRHPLRDWNHHAPFYAFQRIAILLRDRAAAFDAQRGHTPVEKVSRMSGRCDLPSYGTLHRCTQ